MTQLDIGSSYFKAREAAQAALLPYFGSDLVEAAAETRWLSAVDLDGTMTSSDGEPSLKELAERREAVRLLEEGGRPRMLNTVRTFELAVSSALLEASHRYGVMRPKPKYGRDKDGKRIFVPLEKMSKFDYCLDAHAFNGVGTGIFLRHQSSHYVPDSGYAQQLGDWHRDVIDYLRLVDRMDPGARLEAAMADINHEASYDEGKTDVFPPEYRIQLEWTAHKFGKRAGELKELAKELIRKWQNLFRPKEAWRSGRKRIDIVEENRGDEGRFIIYLVPKRSRKEHALTHVIRKIAEATNLVPSQYRVFGAGDTMTDVGVAFNTSVASDLTFLLAGGSRLYHFLSPHGEHAGKPYDGEDIFGLTRLLKGSETEHRGVHRLMLPTFDVFGEKHRIKKVARTVIVGDDAFPGETGPASIAATLEYLRKTVLSVTRQQ